MTAQPQVSCYQGRRFIGGFTIKSRGHFAMVDAACRKIGEAKSRQIAVATLCAGARKSKPSLN
jgi:hypothetical protein